MILPKAPEIYNAGDEQRTRHAITQTVLGITSIFRKGGKAVAINLLGTATNDDAEAGNVGEFKQASLSRASAISLTSGVPANIVSFAPGPGDWDVSGLVVHYPDVTTVVTAIAGWGSDVSASFPTPPTPSVFKLSWPASFVPNDDLIFSLPPRRWALPDTRPIYLSAVGYFTTSTLKAFGIISARRVR